MPTSAVTTRQYPQTQAPSLVDGFLDAARRAPHATALVHGDAEVTYGALLHRAERERARVAAPVGGPVAVQAAKDPGTVALVLACLLERRPVLLPSTALAPDTRALLREHAGVGQELTPLRADVAEEDPAQEGAAPPVSGTPADTGLLLTTSGSTGVPKVVPIRRDAIDRFAAWAAGAFGIGAGTTVLNYAPLNFDLCLLDVWTTLAHGGRVVLVDPDQAMRGRHLLDLAARHRAEVVQAVPMCFRLLADAARETGTVLPAVRHAVCTGDSIPGPLLAELPQLLPDARLYSLYGCTETNDSFLHAVTDPATAAGTGPLPLGRPLPGVDAFLATDDGRVLDGPGTGELNVRTPFQTDGYLGPAADRDVLVPHPEDRRAADDADPRPYFRTGDLVHRAPDGTLTLRGRTDFQVKVRGVRVNTDEVERALLGHPEITEAAVLALPDPVAGRLLHAVARRAPGSTLTSLILRGRLARALPRAAVPTVLRLTDEPLPRTSTGKVDRNHVVRAHFTKEN
ncbi:AMP-binding protein [Streptomyces sp. NPDC002851]